MKIIFVITRALKDSEYENYWKTCLNDSNRKEFRNGNGNSMKIVISTTSDITLHAFDGAYYNSDVDKLACEIKKVVGSSNYIVSPIIVLFHGPGVTKNSLQNKLKEKLDGYEILCKCYSSKDSTISYENYIKPFGNCDNDVNKLVKNLLNEVEGKNRITEAHSLRAEILSPLVALDLIKQAEANGTDINDNLKTQVRTAISNLNCDDEKENKNPIAALWEKCIKCDGFRKKLNDLVKNTNSDWNDYHSNLEHVARKMEEQIAQLER